MIDRIEQKAVWQRSVGPLATVWALGICAVFAGGSGAAETTETLEPGGPEVPNNLCVTLGSLQDGDMFPAIFQGILTRNGEFFDPNESTWPSGIGASTYVEIENLPSALLQLLEKEGRAWVTFRGQIQGPKRGQPDDLALPMFSSFAARRQPEGYGRYGLVRSRFVVREVLHFQEASGFPWNSRAREAFTFAGNPRLRRHTSWRSWRQGGRRRTMGMAMVPCHRRGVLQGDRGLAEIRSTFLQVVQDL